MPITDAEVDAAIIMLASMVGWDWSRVRASVERCNSQGDDLATFGQVCEQAVLEFVEQNPPMLSEAAIRHGAVETARRLGLPERPEDHERARLVVNRLLSERRLAYRQMHGWQVLVVSQLPLAAAVIALIGPEGMTPSEHGHGPESALDQLLSDDD